MSHPITSKNGGRVVRTGPPTISSGRRISKMIRHCKMKVVDLSNDLNNIGSISNNVLWLYQGINCNSRKSPLCTVNLSLVTVRC
jgi:hypothetical protein